MKQTCLVHDSVNTPAAASFFDIASSERYLPSSTANAGLHRLDFNANGSLMWRSRWGRISMPALELVQMAKFNCSPANGPVLMSPTTPAVRS